MKTSLILTIVFTLINYVKTLEENVCHNENDEDCISSNFDYQDDIDWKNDFKELWSWLNSVQDSKHTIKCENEQNIIKDDKPKKFVKPLIGPFPCKAGATFLRYEGKFNKQKLPHGKGKMINEEVMFETKRKFCYDLLQTIDTIEGNLIDGVLHGPAVIKLIHEKTLEVTFEHGIIQGMTRSENK